VTARRLVEEVAATIYEARKKWHFVGVKPNKADAALAAAIVALVRREVAEELREIARADPTLIDTDIGILRAAADRVETS